MIIQKQMTEYWQRWEELKNPDHDLDDAIELVNERLGVDCNNPETWEAEYDEAKNQLDKIAEMSRPTRIKRVLNEHVGDIESGAIEKWEILAGILDQINEEATK